MVNKPAEAHALHTSANDVSFCDHKKQSALSIQPNLVSPQRAQRAQREGQDSKIESPLPSLRFLHSFASFAVKALADC
jgi:hypothetical protein